MATFRTASDIDPAMVTLGSKMFSRLEPQIIALTKGLLSDFAISTSVHRTAYGNGRPGRPVSGPPVYDAIVHDLHITLTWNGLSEGLRMRPQTNTYPVLIHTSDPTCNAYLTPFKSEAEVLAHARSHLGNLVAIEKRRRAMVASGSQMELDPVIAWHLADSGINAEQFKEEVLAHSGEYPRIVHDIDFAIKNTVIEGTVMLSSEVKWAKGTLTITGLQLPDALASAYVGKPVSAMIDHPALESLEIRAIRTYPRDKAAKSTVVLQTKAA